MPLFAQVALIVWPLIVVIIFLSVPPRRAVVVSFVTAWLVLPNIGLSIPGFPNYTKMSATSLTVFLNALLFDFPRFLRFRPHWYDLPIVIWCTSPFYTAITNDMGIYEGIAVTIDQSFSWGIPYLIGRLYLIDLEAMRELALGITVGGLAYVIPCLIEMRLSPIIERTIYGIGGWEGTRYGGYRPHVFLQHGLELGMWMAMSSLIAYQLWTCQTVKLIRGVSFTWLMGILVVTSVLCRSTGATILLMVGLGSLWMVRWTKRSWPIWLLMLIPPVYTATRATNAWSGMNLVEFSKQTFGEDRAQSIEYRLDMENRLAERALQQPIWGWGRFGRSQVLNKEGNMTTVPDGYWIIALGTTGIVGLTSLMALMLLPMIMTIRRFPVATWRDPQVAPVVVLSLMLVITMIDFLSNAMLNPIFAVMIGGLLGQSSVRRSVGLEEADHGLSLASDLLSHGHALESAHEFHRAIQIVADGEDLPGRQVHAVALDGLGHSLMALGRFDEAEGAFRDGLMVRDWIAAQSPAADHFRDLAIARENLARLLTEVGRSAEAVEERQIALKIWDILVADHPRNSDYRIHRLEALNELAWLLVTDPDPQVQQPLLAVELAEEAIAAKHVASWNTLGVARYRSGDWAGAIEALERSALASPDGRGTAFDHFFLAMAWSRLQHETQATEWLERGIAWTAKNRPGHPLLERIRGETIALITSEAGPSTLSRF